MEKKTIRDIDVKGKTILVRVDFNVPIKNGEIQDDNRIRAALPTIKYLIEQGAKIVLCSHLGKPKPKEMTMEEMKSKFSLKPVSQRLSELLQTEVKFAEDSTGEDVKAMVSSLEQGQVGVLENTRFHEGETKNDATYSAELAELADGYVNDAFGSAHRAHSSTAGVAEEMKKQGKETAIGYLMQREVEKLGAVMDSPEEPFIAILGGAKVSDKIGVIDNLMEKVQTIVIGGAMANTFLKAKGYDIGSSKYEADKIDIANSILKKAIEKNVEIILPVDARIARIPKDTELNADTVANAVPESEEEKRKLRNVRLYTEKEIADGKGSRLPEDAQILDVGDSTLNIFAEKLENAKTVVWNGPLGYSEVPFYAHGTQSVAYNIMQNPKARVVIGGGDSVAAYNRIKKEAKENGEDMSKFSHIYASTGGGASLEFMEGKELPGIAVIDNKEKKIVKAEENGKTVYKEI